MVVFVVAPLAARANPVSINPSSLIAFGVVAFWALLIEAGIVALALAVAGVSPLKMFAGFFLANLAVFIFIFYPLLQRRTLPLPALEGLVVALDTAAIMVLSRFALFQGDHYRGVSWWRAGVAALAGNAASYFVGAIASAAPWYERSMED